MTSPLIRRIIACDGPDKASFFQGLLTRDMRLLSEKSPQYALMLTPQGRFDCDMWISAQGDTWFFEIEASQVDAFLKKLSLFKLRAQVQWRIREDLAVATGLQDIPEALNSYQDPRHPHMGWRHHVPLDKSTLSEPPEVYTARRLACQIPEGSLDMTPGKSIPLEFRMEALNAISWDKGCYLGQQLTARTHYTGQLRKSVYLVEFQEKAPSSGTPVLKDAAERGMILSTSGHRALARLYTEDVTHPLQAAGLPLKVTPTQD